MRFRNLEGLTALPVEAIKHRFRNEDVLTVLPVTSESDRESLLVATSSMLIVVTTAAAGSEEWMTQLAPWDVVKLAGDEIDDETHRLVVHVGSLTFHAALDGREGQRALRDFVVVAGAQIDAIRTRS